MVNVTGTMAVHVHPNLDHSSCDTRMLLRYIHFKMQHKLQRHVRPLDKTRIHSGPVVKCSIDVTLLQAATSTWN